jgi:hypothetical protein
MRKTIKQILISRDNLTAEKADECIADAKEAFDNYIDDNDFESAQNICEEFFGLEPDYLDEFL